MASAFLLPQPRHRAEGRAWGRDKLFLPWSALLRGDWRGLEPQLSTTDSIHRSIHVCAVGTFTGARAFAHLTRLTNIVAKTKINIYILKGLSLKY